MKIEHFERYSLKLNKILDNFDEFCKSVNQEADDEIIEKIKKLKPQKKMKIKPQKKKHRLMYISAINFLPTDKEKGDFPMSEKFFIKYDHNYERSKELFIIHMLQVKLLDMLMISVMKKSENYFTISVLAHNQFSRFDFFFFKKRIKPSIWETKQISIGGKNATAINFANIKNQVQFIDTTKFSQQSLASLGDSMTETERKNVQDTCQNFLREKLIFLTENDEKWVLHYLVSGKGTILYQIITDFDSLKRN